MRLLYRLAAAAALCALGSVVALPAAAQEGRNGATGGTVIAVDFPGGSFRMQGGRTWDEVDSRGNVTFRFRETGRDERSVYLTEIGSDKQIQLDLHRMMITISQGGAPRSDLYPITSARRPTPPPVTMPNVPTAAAVLRRANHAEGRFEQGMGGAWTEYDRNGRATYHFREERRTADAVVLLDASRDTRVELNLPRQMIRVSWSNGAPYEDLYPITSTAFVGDRSVPPVNPVRVNVPEGLAPSYGAQLDFKVEAGPITSQQVAEAQCPALAYRLGGTWRGGWERRDGRASVCVIRFER